MIFRIGTGKIPHQRRNRQNLVALRQLRSFHQVDDVQCVPTFQMLVADFFEIGQRRKGLGSLPGNI